jgi:hypothetical protein
MDSLDSAYPVPVDEAESGGASFWQGIVAFFSNLFDWLSPASTAHAAPEQASPAAPTQTQASGSEGERQVVITHTFDSLNRLTAADYSDGNQFSYQYDATGNTLHYTYLVGELSATTVYTYRCNGLSSDPWGIIGCEGDRVSQTVNGVTTHYVLDQAAGLAQVLSDGANTYLYGAGRIAQYSAAGPAYFLTDALGSVRQLVDGSSKVTMAKDYQPYGEELSHTGSPAAFAIHDSGSGRAAAACHYWPP